jgi:hypothetical protein
MAPAAPLAVPATAPATPPILRAWFRATMRTEPQEGQQIVIFKLLFVKGKES